MAVDEERVVGDCVVSAVGTGVDVDGAGVVDLFGPGDRSGPELSFAGLRVFFRPFGTEVLSPLATHGLRRGLHSFAASRLRAADFSPIHASNQGCIKASNRVSRDLRAGCFWLLYNPR